MAKVLGETGRYVTEQAINKTSRLLILVYLFGCATAFLCGYVIAAQQLYISLLGMAITLYAWLWIVWQY